MRATRAEPATFLARAPEPMPAEHLKRFGGGAVGPFGEMLLVGLVLCAFSLPAITALPALGAGTYHLDQHLAARTDSLRALLTHTWAAIRTGWWLGLLTAAALCLLLLNISAAIQGLVPGGMGLAVVTALIGLALAVVLVRSAAQWRPGASWIRLLRAGRTATAQDPVGSIFVLLAFGVGATITWMLPPLVIITPGMLAIALVAGERRRASHTSAGQARAAAR